MDCPEGEEYVPPYRKKDGTYVRGFCRRTSGTPDFDGVPDDEEDGNDAVEL